MGIKKVFHNALFEKVSIAPLVTFRILFGALMFASVMRFWLNGWIETQFIEPVLHFKYFGFHWLPEPSAAGYYTIFILMAISSLLVAFGAFYRYTAALFFFVIHLHRAHRCNLLSQSLLLRELGVINNDLSAS